MTVSVWNPSLAYAPRPPISRILSASADLEPRHRAHSGRKVRSGSAGPRTTRSYESSPGALEVIISTDDAKRKRRKSRSLVKQFEERQRIHERNEQKRREEALNSRRRRQQEATNAYKAALSKEINKRNRTPVSRISSASSIGSQRGRHIYRSPTVDEVLSNIRGHALGGSLRTYGETTNTSRPPPPPAPPGSTSYTPISSFTSPTYVKNVVSFTSRPEIKTDSDRRTSDTKNTLEGVNKITSGMDIRSIGSSSSVISQQHHHVITKQNSKESLESDETLRDSLETDDILAEYHHRSKQPLHDQEKESDPDRIRVQIDLTKFDQLEVSDCESLDDPPIDPTSDDYKPRSDKHTESYSDLSRLGLSSNQKTSPIQLIQAEHVASRATSYFGPSEQQSVNGALRASISDPNVSSSSNKNDGYHIPKSSSHSQLNHVSPSSTESPNYSISTSEGESFIFASSPVEAVKVAASAAGGSRASTAWSTPTDPKPPEPLSASEKKNLKSLIKRTPSAKRKQVRWDSVSALDDATMEVDQFDISSEGEAVFTRQYSHPVRSRDLPYDDSDVMNLQRTPTDAEINALWNKVRTTLHRNTAWDSSTPQSKSNLPHRAPNTRRDIPAKNLQDSLRIYSNVVMDNDVRYKFKRSGKGGTGGPGQSLAGPNISKMTDFTENGHTMLSMEEQRILQSLERLDAKLKDNGTYEPVAEPKTQIVTFSSPTIEISRPPTRNETYKRLLNRKTNGMSAKYR